MQHFGLHHHPCNTTNSCLEASLIVSPIASPPFPISGICRQALPDPHILCCSAIQCSSTIALKPYSKFVKNGSERKLERVPRHGCLKPTPSYQTDACMPQKHRHARPMRSMQSNVPPWPSMPAPQSHLITSHDRRPSARCYTCMLDRCGIKRIHGTASSASTVRPRPPTNASLNCTPSPKRPARPSRTPSTPSNNAKPVLAGNPSSYTHA